MANDSETILHATHLLLANLENRVAFSDLSAADQVRDKTAAEALRLSAFAIRQWRKGTRSAHQVADEIARMAEVVRRATGPILTAEDFAVRMEKLPKNSYPVRPEI